MKINDEPLIKDAVSSAAASETDKNFYIMSGNKIVGSYSIGNVNVDYPYNLCFNTRTSKTVKIALEGLGKNGVRVILDCEQVECTVVPEKLTDIEKNKLLDDICGADADCKAAEEQNIENAKGDLDIKLRVSTCFPETTKVEFIIKPTREDIAAKEVKIIETIPKDCLDNKNLDEFLKKVEGGKTDVIVRFNPMIVWTFPAISKEERVAYQINKCLDEALIRLKSPNKPA